MAALRQDIPRAEGSPRPSLGSASTAASPRSCQTSPRPGLSAHRCTAPVRKSCFLPHRAGGAATAHGWHWICSAELQRQSSRAVLKSIKFQNPVEQRLAPARNAALWQLLEKKNYLGKSVPWGPCWTGTEPSHPLRAKNGQTGERGFINEEKAICARN